MSTYSAVLTSDTLNSAYKRIKYSIRGPLDLRANEIEQELAQGVEKPFPDVIKHIGDPQRFGQSSNTYLRQVMCLLMYPEQLDDPKFPKDVRNRAKDILQSMPGEGNSIGSYTESQGLRKFREEIAEFISKRDGYPSDPDCIFMCNGASSAIGIILKALHSEGSTKTGFMTPVPTYDLYNAKLMELDSYKISYFLDEEHNWTLNRKELKRALDEARPHCNPRALVLINPGNPTGQVLSHENIKEVIKFCYDEHLVLIADEVYQDNIYVEGVTFSSCKKVLRDLGTEFNDFQLISLHSSAKGYMGECGFRGAYFEMVGFDQGVRNRIHNKMCLFSCPNTLGQAMIANICHPPQPGDESYERFMKEKNQVLDALKEKAKLTTELLNSLEGVKCNQVAGAMYAYPRVFLPRRAIEEAQSRGVHPDLFYAQELLENTGIYVVYGAGLGQKEGTYHFRLTILTPLGKTKLMFERLKKFHEEFMDKYRDQRQS